MKNKTKNTLSLSLGDSFNKMTAFFTLSFILITLGGCQTHVGGSHSSPVVETNPPTAADAINSDRSNYCNPKRVEILKKIEKLRWDVTNVVKEGHHYNIKDSFYFRFCDQHLANKVKFNSSNETSGYKDYKITSVPFYKNSNHKMNIQFCFTVDDSNGSHEHFAHFEFDIKNHPKNRSDFNFVIVEVGPTEEIKICPTKYKPIPDAMIQSAHGHGTGTGT